MSVLVTLTAGYAAIHTILANRILLDPLASVAVLTLSLDDIAQLKHLPISKISEVVKDGDPNNSVLLTGYLTKLGDLRIESSDLPSADKAGSIVLVWNAQNEIMAAKSEISKNTCRLVKYVPASETIYLMSDAPVGPRSGVRAGVVLNETPERERTSQPNQK